jgi:hypothetical protein
MMAEVANNEDNRARNQKAAKRMFLIQMIGSRPTHICDYANRDKVPEANHVA